MNREPKLGEQVYIPGSIYLFRGEDDIVGGLATINLIQNSTNLPKDHINYTMVGFKETGPGRKYNWKILLEEQDELAKEYAGQIAHPDPDFSPEFNDPNEGWK
jgi:hypothetical protein